jgi:hypothetical protein
MGGVEMTAETAKCAYCHQERPLSELRKGEIIYIGYDYPRRKAMRIAQYLHHN